jgi:hypothetical protein
MVSWRFRLKGDTPPRSTTDQACFNTAQLSPAEKASPALAEKANPALAE